MGCIESVPSSTLNGGDLPLRENDANQLNSKDRDEEIVERRNPLTLPRNERNAGKMKRENVFTEGLEINNEKNFEIKKYPKTKEQQIFICKRIND